MPIPVGGPSGQLLMDVSGSAFGSAPTWTDVTPWLMTSPQEPNSSELQVSWGRQDWFSSATPSTMSWTLRNNDGRFTPGRSGLVSNLFGPDVAAPGCVSGAVAGFTALTGSTLSQDSTGKLGPNPASLKVSIPGSVASLSNIAYVPVVPVTVGAVYSAAAQIDNLGPTVTANLSIQWINGSGGVISTVLGSGVTTGNTGYAVVTNKTAPALSVSARLLLTTSGGATTGTTTWYVSNLELVQSAASKFETVAPYYPNMKYGVRTRYVETIASTQVNMFDGYVTDLTAQPFNGTYWTVAFNATDIFGRFGQSLPLQGWLAEEMLADHPSCLYPLQEAQGSVTFGDVTGTLPPATIGNSPYGAGIVTAGQAPPDTVIPAMVAVTNSNYATYVTGPGAGSWLSFPSPVGLGNTFTVEAWVQLPTTAPQSPGTMLMQSQDPNTDAAWLLTFVPATGLVFQVFDATSGAGTTIYNGPFSWDGNVHLFSMTSSASTITLFMDGVQLATASSTATGACFGQTVALGMAAPSTTLDSIPRYPFTGAYAYLGIYPTVLSSTRIAKHYQAGSANYSGDLTVDQAITELAGFRANTGVSTQAARFNIGSEDITGATLQQALIDATTADNGYIYTDGTGTLRFLSGSNYNNPATTVTLDASLGHVDVPSTFRDDVQLVQNDVTVSRPNGADQRAFNLASINQQGDLSQSITANIDTDLNALHLAQWAVAQGIQDQLGVPTLTVDIFALASAGKTSTALQVLQLFPLNVVALTNLPGVPPATTVSVQVQGGTYTRTSESASVELYCTPLPPVVTTWDSSSTFWDGPGVWAL